MSGVTRVFMCARNKHHFVDFKGERILRVMPTDKNYVKTLDDPIDPYFMLPSSQITLSEKVCVQDFGIFLFLEDVLVSLFLQNTSLTDPQIKRLFISIIDLCLATRTPKLLSFSLVYRLSD